MNPSHLGIGMCMYILRYIMWLRSEEQSVCVSSRRYLIFWNIRELLPYKFIKLSIQGIIAQELTFHIEAVYKQQRILFSIPTSKIARYMVRPSTFALVVLITSTVEPELIKDNSIPTLLLICWYAGLRTGTEDITFDLLSTFKLPAVNKKNTSYVCSVSSFFSPLIATPIQGFGSNLCN